MSKDKSIDPKVFVDSDVDPDLKDLDPYSALEELNSYSGVYEQMLQIRSKSARVDRSMV